MYCTLIYGQNVVNGIMTVPGLGSGWVNHNPEFCIFGLNPAIINTLSTAFNTQGMFVSPSLESFIPHGSHVSIHQNESVVDTFCVVQPYKA